MTSARFEESIQLPTAVIIGGGGFVGSLVCEKLLDLNVEVVCADFSSKKNGRLQKLGHHPHFHFLDITSPAAFSRLTRAHYFFHILEPGPEKAGQIPQNLGAPYTKIILTLVTKFSAKYLLVLVASGLDPIPLAANISKFHRPTIQIENHYSFIEFERLTLALIANSFRHHRIDARVLWLLDIFGPNMELGNFAPLPSFFHAVKNRQALSLHHDGLYPLFPLYSSDAREAVLKAMFSPDTTSQILFIGSPESISGLNLALLFRQKVFPPLELLYSTAPLPKPTITAEFIKDSLRQLRWKPKVSLLEAIDQTLAWLDTLPPSSPAPAEFTPSPPQRLKPLKKSTPDQPKTTPASNSPSQFAPHLTRSLSSLEPASHTEHLWLAVTDPERSRRATSQSAEVPPSSNWSKVKKIAITFLIILVLSPFLSLATTLTLAASQSRQAIQALSRADFDKSTKMAQAASRQLKFSQDTLSVVGPLASAVKLDDPVFRLEKLLSVASNLSLALSHLSQGAAASLESLEVILGQKTGGSLEVLNTAQGEVTRAYELLSLAESDLNEDRPLLESIKLFGLNSYYQNLKETVPHLRIYTQTARSLLALAPEIIGGRGEKKTYLVLLQNNAELRPTGGFIGSFALVTFDSGRLLDFIVEDVYTADGQLKGYVEPPPPIKDHLGEATWYLRDVNWDPDFPTTARQAEWFLQKELGRTVEGTIALNLYVIQDLLEALGELNLPDYNETITAANLFTRAEYHSEIDFFPGSTQKKDFLSSLASALYQRLKTPQKAEILGLASALNRSIQQSQLLVSFTDPNLDGGETQLDWSGGLVNQISCLREPSCIKDYLGIFEANLGVNKANFFVDRRLHHQITIQRENQIRATTTINYLNRSVAETWPAGKYKNYLRLYVPLGSELDSVVINNQELDENLINVSQEHQKTVFGFLVTIPIQAEATVQVQYTLPQVIDITPQNPLAEYTLFFQKQSGTSADPLSVEVSYPSYLQPVVTLPATSSASQLTSWEVTNETNGQFSIVFTK